jgi:hypothetical protein
MVKIRLRRIGAKHKPIYRIVLADRRLIRTRFGWIKYTKKEIGCQGSFSTFSEEIGEEGEKKRG